jgi:hypothetical protein
VCREGVLLRWLRIDERRVDLAPSLREGSVGVVSHDEATGRYPVGHVCGKQRQMSSRKRQPAGRGAGRGGRGAGRGAKAGAGTEPNGAAFRSPWHR